MHVTYSMWMEHVRSPRTAEIPQNDVRNNMYAAHYMVMYENCRLNTGMLLQQRLTEWTPG